MALSKPSRFRDIALRSACSGILNGCTFGSPRWHACFAGWLRPPKRSEPMVQPIIGITASIDHRSPSFGETYSLTRKYAEGVLQAGGVPVTMPHNLDENALRAVLDRLDGVILSGGGD